MLDASRSRLRALCFALARPALLCPLGLLCCSRARGRSRHRRTRRSPSWAEGSASFASEDACGFGAALPRGRAPPRLRPLAVRPWLLTPFRAFHACATARTPVHEEEGESEVGRGVCSPVRRLRTEGGGFAPRRCGDLATAGSRPRRPPLCRYRLPRRGVAAALCQTGCGWLSGEI